VLIYINKESDTRFSHEMAPAHIMIKYKSDSRCYGKSQISCGRYKRLENCCESDVLTS
jgi:hypothetical protein